MRELHNSSRLISGAFRSPPSPFGRFLTPKRGAPFGRLLSLRGRHYALRRCRKVQRRLTFRGAGRFEKGVTPPIPNVETSHQLTPEFGGFPVAPEFFNAETRRSRWSLAVGGGSSLRPATMPEGSAASLL